MTCWLVATVLPQREFHFRDWMLERGCVAYVPASKYLFKSRTMKKPVVKSRAAHGRYCYVGVDGRAVAMANDDFTGFIRFGDIVPEVKASCVEEIQWREGLGFYDKLPKDPEKVFLVGAQVVVTSGTMEGWRGSISKRPNRRGYALVEINQLVVRVSVDTLRLDGRYTDGA